MSSVHPSDPPAIVADNDSVVVPHTSQNDAQQQEQALESHEVIELQAFSERKTWIEDKIKFLEQMPPVEVFIGLDAIRESAQVIPGLPTKDELRQWIVEHDAIEKETEIFDTGELKKLRQFTRAATQRNLSPEDTDLIELTLTTIYALDKLLHLLRNRSENLDLFAVRLDWEEHRAASWSHRQSILAGLESFFDEHARWSSTIYGNYEQPLDLAHKRQDSSASVHSEASISAPAFSRSTRFKLAENLAREAAAFSARISTLRHGSIASAGKVLDKLIEQSRKPVPEELLDEQDKLEEKGIADLENVGSFAMNVVMQWRKADEFYVETLKDQVAARVLLEEVHAAKETHPNHRQGASFLSKAETLSKRLTVRGNPMLDHIAFPAPTHPLFPAQHAYNATLVELLSSEITTAVDLSKHALSLAKDYKANCDAVKHVEGLTSQAQDLTGNFTRLIRQLEHGDQSDDGDASPPNLMTHECLDSARHSIYLALLPSINGEIQQLDANASQVLKQAPSAFLRLDFTGLDSDFVPQSRSAVQELSSIREKGKAILSDVTSRVGRLREARRIWSHMQSSLREIEAIRREVGETIDQQKWKEEVHHPDAPPTPESPPFTSLPHVVNPATQQQLDTLRQNLARDIMSPLAKLSVGLETPLNDWLSGSASTLEVLLEQVQHMTSLLVAVNRQNAAMTSVRDDFNQYQIRIENVKLQLDSCYEQVLEQSNKGGQDPPIDIGLAESIKSVHADVEGFISNLPRCIPFVARPGSAVTFVKQPYTPLQLQPGSAGGKLVAIPIDLHALDDSVRASSNAIVMRLNGELRVVEQKSHNLDLAKFAKEVDAHISSVNDLVSQAATTLLNHKSTLLPLVEQPGNSDALETLLNNVVALLNDEHPKILQAFAPARSLLHQMESHPAIKNPNTHDALYLARKSEFAESERQLSHWNDELHIFRKQVVEQLQLEARLAEEAKLAEEARLRHEQERIEAEQAESERQRLAKEQEEAKLAAEAEARRLEEEAARLKEEERLEEQRELARQEAAEQQRLEAQRASEERRILEERQRNAAAAAERSRLERERLELEVKLKLAEQHLAAERRLQTEKDRRIAVAEHLHATKDLAEEEDAFVSRPLTNWALLENKISELRRKLRVLSLRSILEASGATPIPTPEHLERLEDDIHLVKSSVAELPEEIEDPRVQTLCRSLRDEVEECASQMNLVGKLASFQVKIENADAALSDLLEHIDSHPSLPTGVMSSSFLMPPHLNPKDQLTSRLAFTRTEMDAVQKAFTSVADVARAKTEKTRILQTWEELEEMATDRIQGRRSRPSSVLSSGQHSGRSSSLSITTPKPSNKAEKAAGYFNLSVASGSRERLQPSSSSRGRRVASTSENRIATPSRASSVRSASGPVPLNIYGSTFASRQRTSSFTPSNSTPVRKAWDTPIIPRTRAASNKRSASPSVSDVSSHSRSNANSRSSTSMSTWSRTPRLSFPGSPWVQPPQRPARTTYVANPKSKLDVAVGDVVNNLPVGISIESVSGSWKDQSGKYWIGDQDPKLCFCRILRSQTVMVRVGGGWTELSKFIHGHFADSFRLLESLVPSTAGNDRSEKWISAATLFEAPEAESPQTQDSPRTPERRPSIPTFSLSTPTGSPHSLKSSPSTKGSPLTALQFMRKAEPEAPGLRPETPSKPSMRNKNNLFSTPSRNSVWRP